MDIETLRAARIAILGAGREGQATAAWLQKHGCQFELRDQAEDKNYLQGLTDFQVVFRTPGLPFLTPELQAAQQAGVEISSHTKLFLALCPAPVIGVSGTKGKGTTAGLVAAMLKQAGKDVKLGGNIGLPPLEFLDQLTPESWVVLELSSFQLQDLTQSPPVAVLTNLTEDHLDHHHDVAEYRAAKGPLFEYQTADNVAIYNADDAAASELAELSLGVKLPFSLADDPVPGAYEVDGELVFDTGGEAHTICRADDVPVPGPHNRRNVLAAALAAQQAGVTPKQMHDAVLAYHGLPHRLELVTEKDGVRYFNDSYAVNPTAAIPALESFSEPIILIAGGYDRGIDYSGFAEAIMKGPVEAVVLMGPAGQRLGEVLRKNAGSGKLPTLVQVAAKEEVVPAAKRLAHPRSVVLLSPGAASFDMFENYSDRGDYFREQFRA